MPPAPDRERVAEQPGIAKDHGNRILANPTTALEATARDIAKCLSARTLGTEQLTAACQKTLTSPRG